MWVTLYNVSDARGWQWGWGDFIEIADFVLHFIKTYLAGIWEWLFWNSPTINKTFKELLTFYPEVPLAARTVWLCQRHWPQEIQKMLFLNLFENLTREMFQTVSTVYAWISLYGYIFTDWWKGQNHCILYLIRWLLKWIPFWSMDMAVAYLEAVQ